MLKKRLKHEVVSHMEKSMWQHSRNYKLSEVEQSRGQLLCETTHKDL